jgi:hypothetical protein
MRAEVQLLDPLRLLLSLHYPHHGVSRIWIQIPRMYPHRPPVISRMENMGMDQILITDEPPGGPQHQAEGQDTFSSNGVETTLQGSLVTVLYNQWSPVRHLGDLLIFLLQISVQQPPGSWRSSLRRLSRDSSFAPTTASLMSVSAPLTVPLASTCTSSNSSTSSFSQEVSSSALTVRMRPAAYFQDEHKVDEFQFVGSYTNNHKEARTVVPSAAAPPVVFAPNRFDMGYGKYQDPLTVTRPQDLDPYAMEL